MCHHSCDIPKVFSRVTTDTEQLYKNIAMSDCIESD